ncbi:MAG: type I 3-dehydroquinate dehydratase [Candidatus Kariarchaeaceae archaeon]
MRLAVVFDAVDDTLIRELPSQVIREFRIDLAPELLQYVRENRDSFNFRFILTLRSQKEGGKYDSEDRHTVLRSFYDLRPDYIDLEIDRDLDLLPEIKDLETIAILSMHDYSGPMIVAATRFKEKYSYLSSDLHILKFVGKPHDTYDMLKSLEILIETFPRHVILGIGKHGILSRTLCTPLNQEFVFGARESGEIPHYNSLIHLGNDPILLGLIGSSLEHSLSPKIHSFLLKKIGKQGYYHLFEIHEESRVKEVLDKLSRYQLKGVNITFPYKKVLSDYPVNTIKFSESTETKNTDILGFRSLLDRFYNISEKERVVVIGAGGAALSVVEVLSAIGAEILVLNRTKERFESWNPDVLSQIAVGGFEFDLESWKPVVYINATSLGYSKTSIQELVPIPSGVRYVIDLNYGKGDTGLVQYAKKSGLKAVDGKLMLFYQAAKAFEWWNDVTLDTEKLYEEFRREF